MNKETLETLVEKESQKSSITSKDIPDLDLYMDQIMTLFETHLANHKKNEDDKLLTKTMINNYSKAKVITPVKGKKYTKEQIIQMLIIYQLKWVVVFCASSRMMTASFSVRPRIKARGAIWMMFSSIYSFSLAAGIMSCRAS